MAKTPTADDIKTMSFEQALAELEKIVERLESGDSKLDDAISSYERGAALKLHCETKLREAQDKVERIKLAADGSVTSEPTEIA
jgi:exodeoxyribonuclease VII small subunit